MRIHDGEMGSLARFRTCDSLARRRYDHDEDLMIDGLCPYRRDADMKISLSKSFRQLMFKTQVLSSPLNGLVRNRASHTIEVAGFTATIAGILGLNVDLARAIALGHDIGHVPFGHAGESFLSKCLGVEFRHEVFGVIRAQKIERLGKGINLTQQTLSGILTHSRGSGSLTVSEEMSAEATVVMYSDKINYILSDYNDLVKRRLLPEDETRNVTALINELGSDQRERMNNLIMAFCRESVSAKKVCFDQCPEARVFQAVKAEMYNLYGKVNSQGVEDVLSRVYEYVKKKIADVNPALIIALMNDKDILFLSSKTIFDRSDFNQTSVAEQLPHIRKLDPELSLTCPDLDW